MPTPVTVFTAARMLAIEALAVTGAQVVGDNLVMTRKNGTTFVAGNVRGNPGTMTQAELDSAIQALLETTGLPAAPGAAALGLATKAARSDHVHPVDPLSAIVTGAAGASSPFTLTAGVLKKRNGWAQLRLSATATAAFNGGDVICTVPTGFRPLEDFWGVVVNGANGGTASLRVRTDGFVQPATTGSSGTVFQGTLVWMHA